jgi:hypothetical protein
VGLEFIDRTLKTTGLVLLIFLPFGVYYLGVWPSLAVFSGGVWGMVNLIFTSAVVRATIKPGKADKMKVLGLAMFKFPLLYLSGYALLKVPQFTPLYLLCGFTSILAIIVLKGIGMAMMKAGDQTEPTKKAQGVA